MTIRTVFALLLWSVALFPLVLYGAHLHSPVTAVQIALAVGGTLRSALWFGALAAMVAAVVYPPFLPSLRIGLRRLKSRLTTDQGPLRQAQERLRNFETSADHVIVGRALVQQGNLPQAVVHLRRAVELEPDRPAPHYHLGLALAKHGDLAGAAAQLGAAVATDPSHAFGQAMLELGVTYERGGADDQAIEVLRRQRQEFGDSRRSGYHLARALARRGHGDEAQQLLKQVGSAPDPGQPFPLEDQLFRARARVALLLGRSR